MHSDKRDMFMRNADDKLAEHLLAEHHDQIYLVASALDADEYAYLGFIVQDCLLQRTSATRWILEEFLKCLLIAFLPLQKILLSRVILKCRSRQYSLSV